MSNANQNKHFSIFSYGFRPFFLACAIYAILPLIPWGFYLAGWFDPSISLQAWHAHEMLFGFVTAGAAGFLLTAIPNWTGAPAMTGNRLRRLFLCWLAGRAAFWAFLYFNHPVFGYLLLIDLLLPIFHGAHIARVLIGTKQSRNFIFIGIMAMFVFANILFILDFNGITTNTAQVSGIFIANVIMIMIAVVGGRVTPNFTRAWLRQQEIQATIRTFPLVEKLAIVSLVALAVVDLFAAQTGIAYGLALLAGVIHLIRFSQWASFKTLNNPSLWILHLGYGWLIIALFLKGSESWLHLPYHLYVHAFTVGTVGSYMLGIMSRAALGHTGRVLSISTPITLAYFMILAAAIIRITTPFFADFYADGMIAAMSLWIGAFALYLWVYTPILTTPRIDGKPG